MANLRTKRTKKPERNLNKWLTLLMAFATLPVFFLVRVSMKVSFVNEGEAGVLPTIQEPSKARSMPDVADVQQKTARIQSQQQQQQQVVVTTADSIELDDLHPITKALLQGRKVFLYNRKRNGIGSALLNFFLLALYYEDTQNRTVAVFDDRNSPVYRRSRDVGASGFFDFKFPVLNNQRDWDQLFDEFQRVGLGKLANETLMIREKWNDTTAVDSPIIWVRTNEDYNYFDRTRKKCREMYMSRGKFAVKNLPVFERFKNLTCRGMWFNNETLQYTRQRLQEHSIPDFALSKGIQPKDGTSITGRTGSLGTTVAFHIRRGDKVFGKRYESAFFTADQYVKKFLAIPEVNAHNVKHCFVESDEYNATVELQTSLQEHNISCQFHTMVPLRYMRTLKETNSTTFHNKFNFAYQDRKDVNEVWVFLSGLYMMVHATYFMGSFKSNVGGLVALLRGCVWKKANNDGYDMSYNNSLDHFYHSYGVETNNWFIHI